MIQAKQELLQALARALAQLAPEAPPVAAFESPKQAAHGDLAITAAMPLARGLKKNPREIAQALVEALKADAAVQRWVHDLAHFRTHSPAECDHIIGRRRTDHEELDDAPESAHVKRSAQESYEPPAFMLRRSMPWAGTREQGLEFIAFGHSLDAFEQVLRRMAGLEDGIVDALFTFSRPLTGGYYWCPPLKDGRLDLSLLLP